MNNPATFSILFKVFDGFGKRIAILLEFKPGRKRQLTLNQGAWHHL
jgi:hypothetical protein